MNGNRPITFNETVTALQISHGSALTILHSSKNLLFEPTKNQNLLCTAFVDMIQRRHKYTERYRDVLD